MARDDAARLLASAQRLANALAEGIDARRDIDMAIGVIRGTTGVDEATAERILHGTAEERGVTLRVSAQQIINVGGSRVPRDGGRE